MGAKVASPGGAKEAVAAGRVGQLPPDYRRCQQMLDDRQCRAWAVKGTKRCLWHSKIDRRKCRKGGRNCAKGLQIKLTDARAISGPAELTTILGRVLSGVLAGGHAPRDLATLCTAFLKAYELKRDAEIEKRLAALEERARLLTPLDGPVEDKEPNVN